METRTLDPDKVLIFACSEGAKSLTDDICMELGLSRSHLRREVFRNGNIMPKFKAPKGYSYPEYNLRGRHIWLVQTIDGNIDRRWVELMLTIDAAKQSHAGRVGVVLPYLPYARSDKKDQSRIGCGLQVFIRSIEAQGLDYAIVCDPHNPATMQFFSVPVDCVTARFLISDHVKGLDVQVVVSPDISSVKRARKLAKRLNVPYGYIDKHRDGNKDRAVADSLSGVDVDGKVVLVIDDEADTCGTVEEAVKLLKAKGAVDVYLAFTHAVLSGDAFKRLSRMKVDRFIATDTVPHTELELYQMGCRETIIETGKLFADAVRNIEYDESLGDFYDHTVED
jgi:ribose-phosphate pyrophosphokinase